MGTGSELLDYMKHKRLTNHFSVPIFVGIKKKISSDLTIETWCLIFVFIKYNSLFWQVSTKTFRLKLYLLCVEPRNRRRRLAGELTVLRLPTHGEAQRGDVAGYGMNVCQIWNLEQLITDRGLSLLSEYTSAFHLMFSYNYIYPDRKFKFILSYMPRHGDKHSNNRGQCISLLNNRAAEISF